MLKVTALQTCETGGEKKKKKKAYKIPSPRAWPPQNPELKLDLSD